MGSRGCKKGEDGGTAGRLSFWPSFRGSLLQASAEARRECFYLAGHLSKRFAVMRKNAQFKRSKWDG